MRYSDFKNIIMNQEVNENLYDELISIYGYYTINSLFEVFNKDIKIDEDIREIKTRLYLGKKSSINIDDNEKISKLASCESITYIFDSLIDCIPMSEEEEKEKASKLVYYRDELNKRNINIKELNEKIIKLGYDDYDKNYVYLSSLNNKLFFLSKTNNKDLIDDLNIYIEYQKLFEEFVNANRRLVVSIARKYGSKKTHMNDLIQYGTEGLIKAIERYDVSKGNRFSTYATDWIRQVILRNVTDNENMIRIPNGYYQLIYEVEGIIRNYKKLYLKEPTDEYIINEFNKKERKSNIAFFTLSKEKLEDMRMILNRTDVISYYTIIGDDEDCQLIDKIPCSSPPIENSIIDDIYNKDLLDYTVKSIPKDKNVLVLLLRLGFPLKDYMSKETFTSILTVAGKEEDDILKYYNKAYNNDTMWTLLEIGTMINVSAERVRQIEKETLNLLKNKLNYNQEFRAKIDPNTNIPKKLTK